jgi:hypothetical protein
VRIHEARERAHPVMGMAAAARGGGTARRGGERPDYSFARVGVLPLGAAASVEVKRQEKPAGQAPAASTGSSCALTGTPTLTVTGAGAGNYDDSGGESHKRVKYTVSVPLFVLSSSYCLVQEVEGFGADGRNGFFQVLRYGTTGIMYHPGWEVDSMDADPILGSTSDSRWNYERQWPTGFTHQDDPGPALSSEKGATYALRFRVGVYETDKVPARTSGPVGATPVGPLQYWNYSVVVGQDGRFSHPPPA